MAYIITSERREKGKRVDRALGALEQRFGYVANTENRPRPSAFQSVERPDMRQAAEAATRQLSENIAADFRQRAQREDKPAEASGEHPYGALGPTRSHATFIKHPDDE